MLKNIIIFILSIISINLFAQKSVNIPLAPDFKIITSSHDTLHLYKTLSEGKTVVLNLFQVICGPCLINTSTIDSAFLLYGSNQNNVVFWGISNIDSNNTIKQFADVYNVRYPCVGIEGLGDTVLNLLEAQMGTFEFPTYAIICPTDKTIHWNVNHPVKAHGFDQIINTCNEATIIKNNIDIENNKANIKKDTVVENNKTDIKNNAISTENEKVDVETDKIDIENNMVRVFPNPTTDFVNIEIKLEHSANLKCDLLGGMGEKLSSREYPNVQSGLSKFKISFNGMREGNYYLTIYEDGNLVFAGMIVKVKNK